MSGQLSIIDVGQGDCVVLSDLEFGEAILIDCPVGRGQLALDFLSRLAVNRLRAVIVSHLHRDHYGGIEEVLERLMPTPEALWLSLAHAEGRTVPPAGRAVLNSMRKFARERRVECRLLSVDRHLSCGRVRLDILSPDDNAQIDAVARADPNWSSLVASVDLCGFRVLLGSDAPPGQWQRLIDAGVDLKADVLLVPHHGAAFGASPSQLQTVLSAVSPAVLVVSVGARNTYGHPDRTTLDVLGRYAITNGARLVCTQLNKFCAGRTTRADEMCGGTISISRTADQLVVHTENGQHHGFVAGLASARCRL